MSRARTHHPYTINFGQEKHGDSPWTLTLTLSRHTGRGCEHVRHVFSEDDLTRLQTAFWNMKAANRKV